MSESDDYLSKSTNDEDVNSINSFLDNLNGVTRDDKLTIEGILKSKVMTNSYDSRIGFQEEIKALSGQANKSANPNFQFLRQYLRAVEHLPLNNNTPGPISANKIFVMEHINEYFDNLAIKMMTMIVGCECKIFDCVEGANDGGYFGYMNDYFSKEPLTGAVIQGVSACNSLSGMIVFHQAEYLFEIPGIMNLIDRNNRKKFIDRYLAFPLDLSKFTILFFVDNFNCIPSNLQEHFHKMDYNFIQTIKIKKKSSSKNSIQDNESVHRS